MILKAFCNLNKAPGITCESSRDADYMVYLKLFILLFADDTVLLSNTKEDLQIMLNIFENYCNEWKIKVNTTKALLFSNGGVPKDQQFYFKGEPLEMVNEYKYLGIFLTRSGSYLLVTTKKYIADQANNALF